MGLLTMIREVQRLRRQVQELEAKLTASSPQWCDGGKVDEAPAPYRWSGTYVGDLHFGPSSLTYFVHRLAKFTSMDLQVKSLPKIPRDWTSSSVNDPCQMERSQQDYFLALFWQGYHAIYPILDEAEFHRHYDSLWSNQSSRKPCPLLDIILALCTRHSSFIVAQHPEVTGDLEQLSHDFYSRARYHLDQDEYSPTLLSTQAAVFVIVYLLTFGDYETAYVRLGAAFKMANALGPLHQTSNENLDSKGKGLQYTKKSVWNCLLTLDKRISLHLGRPSTVTDGESSKILPRDHDEQDQIPDSEDRMPSARTDLRLDARWHRFQVEHHRLFQIGHDTQTELATLCETVLEETNSSDFYNHPQSREKCASFLLQKFQRLEAWVQELPDSLKTPRVQGVPFSVDRSFLNLGIDTPLWLQLQRLVLELDYHALCVTLKRTFITFSPVPTLGTLSSDNHCISCTNHAIAMTNILYQVLRDTEILTGWFQVTDWQRTAMFAAAGFACGYPICPPTPSSRKALITAASVFEMVEAPKLAHLSRQLDNQVVEIIRAFTARLGISTPNITPAPSLGDEAKATERQTTSTDSSTTNLDFGGFGDSFDLDAEGGGLWGGDASLLWGDLMRDMGMNLTPSLGEEDLAEIIEQ